MGSKRGTNKLCRTEVWRNNKLNGVRKRFDREGNLIEEILFKDGNAICKTNFELADSLTYIRKPIDSNLVYTEVYTMAGALLASGHERIYNPDNLFWFQNIELTALNSIAVSASRGQSPVAYAQSQQPVFLSSDEGNSIQFHPQINLYGAPSLVTYKKEGNWIYYKEYSGQKLNMVYAQPLATVLGNDFRHFGKLLNDNISNFDLVKIVGYDSILVKFENDQVKDFYGFGKVDYTHLEIRYYTSPMASVALFTIDLTEYPKHVKTLGQYNRYGEKVGVWKHYDRYGSLYKKEEYLIPRKPEDEEDLGNN
ncbi:MAG TPA: hypothetical protein VK177_12695 [Flavobacteriales bacterium]|nr:hypothetical protein [Flavobacteriales bacterium]